MPGDLKEFVLYGAGGLGKLAYQWLQLKGRSISQVCDSDSNKWGKVFFDHPIVQPDEVDWTAVEGILVGSQYFEDISHTLQSKYQVPEGKIYQFLWEAGIAGKTGRESLPIISNPPMLTKLDEFDSDKLRYFKEAFFHIHLRKTGGSSLNTFLGQHLGPQRVINYGHFCSFTSSEEIREGLLRYPWIVSVCSHMLCLDLPWDMTEREVYGITVIREPVETQLSYYRYAHALKDYNDANDELSNWVGELEQKREVEVGFCNVLRGRKPTVDWEMVRQQVRRERLILFPFEKLPQLFEYLHEKFPHIFGPSENFWVNKSNVKPPTENIDAIRERIRKLVDPEDFRAYEYAHEAADYLLQQL